MTKQPRLETDANSRAEGTTRVDFAHATNGPDDNLGAPPLDLLQAIAGRDAELAPQQLRNQAMELAGILREKQRLLDQRESELNARTAMLENELRQVRLRQYHDLALPEELAPGLSIESIESIEAGTGSEASYRTDGPAVPRRTSPAPSPSPHVLDQTDPRPARDHEPSATRLEPPLPFDAGDASLIETDLSQAARQAEAECWPSLDATDYQPVDPVADTSRPATRAELKQECDRLEHQRQLMRQREAKVERRERNVEQLHEEVTELHRAALELRLACEHIWVDLNEQYPAERLNESLSDIRNRISDHYQLANATITRRLDELHQLRAELNVQDQRLRQQRRDVQMWADRRYDEVEARLAKLTIRERELDQMEGEFHRQAMQWQHQRETYRREIESLSWKLHDQPVTR